MLGYLTGLACTFYRHWPFESSQSSGLPSIENQNFNENGSIAYSRVDTLLQVLHLLLLLVAPRLVGVIDYLLGLLVVLLGLVALVLLLRVLLVLAWIWALILLLLLIYHTRNLLLTLNKLFIINPIFAKEFNL